jgi:hypothetical protein
MRGRNNHHNNNRKNQNPLTRVYESNGPDVKIRGTASHVAEKYVQLARDATTSGDPVTAENYHQHAEHYFRLIAVAQEQFRQQNPYYRPEGETQNDNRDESFDDADDGTDQPMQGEPNFGNQQPYPQRDGQPSSTRELQSYGGRDQQPHQQGRPQPHQQRQQPQQPQPHQHHQPQPAPQQNQQPRQSTGAEGTDGDRLPSFITGSQPQQNPAQNGYDNQGGDRYQMHRRRRRHRGIHRQDTPGGAQGTSGGDAPDDSRPDSD